MKKLEEKVEKLERQNAQMLANQEEILRLLKDGLDPYVQGLEGVGRVMKVSKSFIYQNKELLDGLTPRHISQKIALYKRDEIYKKIEGMKER